MIDFLLGVPGKLKTVIDHLTTNLSSTRAAKIDQLDAAISTRAAASTAVSNADYTSGRAAKLDNVAQERSPIAANFTALPVWRFTTGNSIVNVATQAGQKTDSWTSGTDYTLVNLTGPGIVNFLVVRSAANNGVTMSLTFIVDGVTIHNVESLGAGDGTSRFRAVIGALVGTDGSAEPSQILFSRLAYKTSLVVKLRASTTGTLSAYVYLNGFRQS